MEDLTGKQFGPYRIVSPLGEGGMAAVYKAYQASVDRYVALKVLPRYFASDPAFVGRFVQEAKMLAKLQHPRILAVHDFGESEGYTYIVMPFVDSGTLDDILRGNPLPMPQAVQIVTQVAEALDYAHSFGVVHRDVKPSNVLLDRSGNCLLTDFGIAKMVEGTSQFTRTGSTIGTPAYMSPEQIQGEHLDGRSDVYSLGIMLYEMATGRPPFRAETPPAVFVKHLHDPLPPPHIYQPGISEAVERVILKGLAKDRAERFQTAGSMADALNRALAGQPTELAGVPEVKRMAPTEAAPIIRPKPRTPVWLIALLGFLGLAVLGSLVAVVLTFANRPGREEAAQATEPPPIVTEPLVAEPTRVPPTETPRPTQTVTRVPATATRAPATATPLPAVAPTRGVPDPRGELVVQPGQPIRLAFVGALSGIQANIGQTQKDAFMMALEEAEPLYGFAFSPEAALIGDSACSELGLEVAREIVAEGNLAGVVGGTCSPSCLAAGPYYEERHLVAISPSCTQPQLTEMGWEHFNRVLPRDDRGSDVFSEQVAQSQEYQDFALRYQDRYKQPLTAAPHGGYAYDATRILIGAIRQVASVDEAGNLIVGRQALMRAVRDVREFPGVTGPISLNEQGDRMLPAEMAESPEACQPGELRIGLVADTGGMTEGSLNVRVWDGILRATETLPVCAYLALTQQAEDYEPNLARLADAGYDLVIVPGFTMIDALSNVARQHPETRFVAVDFELAPARDNVVSILYRVDQAAFQAGYLAAAWAELKDPADARVGYLGGMKIDRVEQFTAAYQAGVKHYNQQRGSDVSVQGVFVGRFDSPDEGHAEAVKLLDAGVDVLFCAAGMTGFGGLQAVLERGKWGIGVDTDQALTVPRARPILLTSVTKQADTTVYLLIDLLVQGEFRGGRVHVGSIADGGVSLAPFHAFESQIPNMLKVELEEIRSEIVAGTIQTGW